MTTTVDKTIAISTQVIQLTTLHTVYLTASAVGPTSQTQLQSLLPPTVVLQSPLPTIITNPGSTTQSTQSLPASTSDLPAASSMPPPAAQSINRKPLSAAQKHIIIGALSATVGALLLLALLLSIIFHLRRRHHRQRNLHTFPTAEDARTSFTQKWRPSFLSANFTSFSSSDTNNPSPDSDYPPIDALEKRLPLPVPVAITNPSTLNPAPPTISVLRPYNPDATDHPPHRSRPFPCAHGGIGWSESPPPRGPLRIVNPDCRSRCSSPAESRRWSGSGVGIAITTAAATTTTAAADDGKVAAGLNATLQSAYAEDPPAAKSPCTADIRGAILGVGTLEDPFTVSTELPRPPASALLRPPSPSPRRWSRQQQRDERCRSVSVAGSETSRVASSRRSDPFDLSFGEGGKDGDSGNDDDDDDDEDEDERWKVERRGTPYWMLYEGT